MRFCGVALCVGSKCACALDESRFFVVCCWTKPNHSNAKRTGALINERIGAGVEGRSSSWPSKRWPPSEVVHTEPVASLKMPVPPLPPCVVFLAYRAALSRPLLCVLVSNRPLFSLGGRCIELGVYSGIYWPCMLSAALERAVAASASTVPASYVFEVLRCGFIGRVEL